MRMGCSYFLMAGLLSTVCASVTDGRVYEDGEIKEWEGGHLVWETGSPLYIVEHTHDLVNGEWVQIAVTTNGSYTVEPDGFYRILVFKCPEHTPTNDIPTPVHKGES